jgi:iron complex outermembrane receptor protein
MNIFKLYLPVCLAYIGLLGWAQDAMGQATGSAAADSDSLVEIVVTAQKRSERLQDVPMSITAADAQRLQSLGITNTGDLGKLVPGFTAQKTLTGLPVYFIRGIGFFDTTVGVSPGVTVYTDQLPLPFSSMSRGAVLDLERVEVLKGPQGTLFGENSTGGAINFIAAKPTDHLEAGFSLTGGRFDQVDGEAFVSGPISDKLSARLAVRKEYEGDWQQGYTDNATSGEKHFFNARLIVDWHPIDAVKFESQISGWRDNSDTQQPQFIQYYPTSTPAMGGNRPSFPAIASFPPAPNDDRAAGWYPGFGLTKHDSFYQVGLRGDVDISDRVTLTSLTSYEKYKTETPAAISGTTFPINRTVIYGDITSFSQEIRFSGSINDNTKWMAGGNYQGDRVEEDEASAESDNSVNHIGPFVYHAFEFINNQKASTKSAFGSLDYKIIDTLTAQASARYTRQDRSFSGCSRDPGDGRIATAFSFLSSLLTRTPQVIEPGSCITLNPDGTPHPQDLSEELDQSNVSWRGGLSWKPESNILLYANITKGYKSGSFPSIPAAVSTQLHPISQESVLAYETGFKTTLFSNKLELDGAGFYYDYRDKQLLGTTNVPPYGPLGVLVSIPKSKVEGAELSLAVRPVAGLQITVGGTYVKTEILKDPPDPTGPLGNIGSFVGERFPFTPSLQGVMDAMYTFHVSDSLHAFVGTSLTARNSTSSTLISNVPAVATEEALLHIPGYSTIGLRAGVQSNDEAWRIELWGRNITNRFYIESALRSADDFVRFTAMPATFGVTLTYRFHSDQIGRH